MQPIHELVKYNSTFTWNKKLDQLFNNSKDILISEVKEGIYHSFDTSHKTILQTDWSKEGIGYPLLQKYCECDTKKAPTCCLEGWKLVFAWSHFTTPSESRYSPTEGELLAVAWALDNAKMFVLDCQNLQLLQTTNHYLVLCTITSSKTFLILTFFPSTKKPSDSPSTQNTVQGNGIEVLMQYLEIQPQLFPTHPHTQLNLELPTSYPQITVITLKQIQHKSWSDNEYQTLISVINNNFHTSQHSTIPLSRNIRRYTIIYQLKMIPF